MSIAGLKYQAAQWGHNAAHAETKSGSYIYTGTASAYHDWKSRPRIRVLQHEEKQRREVLKDMRGAAFAGSQSSNARAGDLLLDLLSIRRTSSSEL